MSNTVFETVTTGPCAHVGWLTPDLFTQHFGPDETTCQFVSCANPVGVILTADPETDQDRPSWRETWSDGQGHVFCENCVPAADPMRFVECPACSGCGHDEHDDDQICACCEGHGGWWQWQ